MAADATARWFLSLASDSSAIHALQTLRGETDSGLRVAVLLEEALRAQCCDEVGVRRLLVQVECLLPHRAEVAGGEVAERLQLLEFVFGQGRLEHPLEEGFLAGIVEIVERELEREAAHDGRIEIRAEVRRRDHHTVEVLHLLEEFIHLRNLPARPRVRAVLDESVDFVEEENHMFRLRTLKGLRDVLLGFADVLREEVRPLHHKDLAVEFLPEMLHEFRLARPGRTEHQEVHARLVLARRVEGATFSYLSKSVNHLARPVVDYALFGREVHADESNAFARC